jgi:glycosyltransferase involved in cell wall biosynthesis
MSATPRVSIGVPVYNGQRYLAQALDSILAQTFGDFELIVSDNASTDATSDICQRYVRADPRVAYHRNPHNLGAAPNYNRAFTLARAPYFKWADYDDLLAPDLLERCVEVLDRDADVVLVYPRSREIDEHGLAIGDYRYKADASSPDPKIRFRNIVLRPDTAYQVSGLMRSDAVRRTRLHGSFPASDLVFLAELAFYGRFHEIDAPLFFPRYHPDQSTKGAGTIERNRVVFFDTANAGRLLLPKWQYLGAYLTAIGRSPLGAPAKLYCAAQVARWVAMPDHFRALGKDVLLAGRQLLRRGQASIRGGRAAS